MGDHDRTEAMWEPCPGCGEEVDVSCVGLYTRMECPQCGGEMWSRSHLGHYRITEMLGEGGMSHVFRAADFKLGREVALKVLRRELGEDASVTSMFEKEARATASIVHPHVVKVYTVGRDQGYFFIVMELVDGPSLETWIETHGAVEQRRALEIARDVTSGLEAAEQANLIHRDIKPGNILLASDGTTKLVDFGLALEEGGEDTACELWATPFYVPPEKLEGQPDTRLGDVYSLGAALFHAIAGRPPYDANTASMEELSAIKSQALDFGGKEGRFSKAVIRLIERMMARLPQDRPQSYREITRSIDEILDDSPFRPDWFPRRIWTAASNGKTLALAGGALLLSGMLAFAVAGFRTDSPEPDTTLLPPLEETVWSQGNADKAEVFQQARDMLATGQWEQARTAFLDLRGEENFPVSTRCWILYFLGLGELSQENPAAAREYFLSLAELPLDDRVDRTILQGLQESARLLTDPLPVMEEEMTHATDGVLRVTLLAAGMKNWYLGRFDQAFPFFERFVEAPPVPHQEWLETWENTLHPWMEDYLVYMDLPHPSRNLEAEERDRQREILQEALPRLQTRGAMNELAQRRLQRLGGAVSSTGSAQAPVE